MLSVDTLPVNQQVNSVRPCPYTESTRIQWKEPLPTNYYVALDRFKSAGGSFEYEVAENTGPLCRLYYNEEKGRLEPHSFENGWTENKETGKWQKRKQGNYISYLCTIIGTENINPIYVTVRWDTSKPPATQFVRDLVCKP